jgi:hypothetical protein
MLSQREKGEFEMSKRMLFVAVVLLIVSTTAFSGQPNNHGSYGNSGGTQTQIAVVGIAQGSVAIGSGAGYSQFAGGGVNASQSMHSPLGSMRQSTNPTLFGGGTGYTGWFGAVGGGWIGLSGSYQTQSLPSPSFGPGFGGPF